MTTFDADSEEEDVVAVETISSLVQTIGKNRPTAPAYSVKAAGAWRSTNWGEYARQVRQAGRALIALGVAPGDRVAIIGFNRPEWLIMDVAAMSAGGVPVGIYTTSSPEELQYVAHHAEVPILLVEDESQWDKVDAVRDQLPHLRHVVTMEGAPAIDDPLVMSWSEFMRRGDDAADSDVESRIHALEEHGLATLIYTSGTTGPPKGVMLSNRNLIWTATQAVEMFSLTPSDRSISYLPLSHIAEQMFTIHAPAVAGSQVFFAESIDALAENLKEIRPTVFFGVPRVWEKFHAGVKARLDEATGVKARLASWAMGVARKVNQLRNRGEEPTGLLATQYRLADKLVLSKVKDALGFDQARILASGAAPISQDIVEFFGGLDLRILEVYGQSEGSGPTTFNRFDRTRWGTVGPPYPGTEVKIAEDGEVLLAGPNVFLGYFKDEEATKATLEEDWLHTGDLGEFDDDGFLKITGRKKDIIITAGGKNIAPALFESDLKNHALISEVVVIGDRRKYLTALITLEEESAARFCEERGLEGPPHQVAAVREAVAAAVEDVNHSFARVEQIKKFTILPRELSIADGELTPTLKVKRSVVNEHFAAEIEEMYRD